MESSDFIQDRRAAERFLVSWPVDTGRGPAVTRDVSVSGFYLLTDAELSVGEQLRLGVSLSFEGRALPLRLDLRGEVVRVEHAEHATGAGVALDQESARILAAT